MATEKQYYVKVNFEYGVDNGDGTFDVKNSGEAEWVSMGYGDAAGLQNYAVIPALNMMNTKAGELGMIVSGLEFPAVTGEAPKVTIPKGSVK